MNTLTDTALAKIPGYTAAQTARATLASWRPLEMPHTDPTGLLVNAAERGDPAPPAEFLELVARRITGHQAVLEGQRILNNAKSEADERINELVRNRPDPALQFLAERLAKIVDVVRDAAGLPDITSTDEAMQAGPAVLAGWQRLTNAADEYDELRRAQWEIVRRLRPPEGIGDRKQHREWFLRTGLVADFLDVDAWWWQRRVTAAGATLARDVTGDQSWHFGPAQPNEPIGQHNKTRWPGSIKTLAAAPGMTRYSGPFTDTLKDRRDWLLPNTVPAWPSPVAAGTWWPNGEHVRYLRWICAHARPWVPTAEQLRDADTTALTATEQLTRPSLDMLGRAADATIRHATITPEEVTTQ